MEENKENNIGLSRDELIFMYQQKMKELEPGTEEFMKLATVLKILYDAKEKDEKLAFDKDVDAKNRSWHDMAKKAGIEFLKLSGIAATGSICGFIFKEMPNNGALIQMLRDIMTFENGGGGWSTKAFSFLGKKIR